MKAIGRNLGELIQNQDATRPPRSLVYAVAGIDRKAREVILHAANPSSEPREIAVNLKGWNSDKPATEWIEALPIGNSRIGAMIFAQSEDENDRSV